MPIGPGSICPGTGHLHQAQEYIQAGLGRFSAPLGCRYPIRLTGLRCRGATPAQDAGIDWQRRRRAWSPRSGYTRLSSSIRTRPDGRAAATRLNAKPRTGRGGGVIALLDRLPATDRVRAAVPFQPGANLRPPDPTTPSGRASAIHHHHRPRRRSCDMGALHH